ncbi:MAG: NAD(P)/FAD-dependent oxidoreductase [Clostridiales bacterium]|jgi:protoporphyrinogen oxidase|nr:NAD(P)/FAD-dependent oxidoreductase [Clostridiales bacterium]
MDIAVIGAGATGLAAGYELAKKGHAVTVFEKDKLGGLASARPIGETYIDDLYHHIFTSDREIIAYIDELGLSGSLTWVTPSNGLYMDRLYPFTNPADLLTFPAISFADRVRTGLTVLTAKGVSSYKRFEDVSARDWLISRTGARVYEKLWRPLLYAKFDSDADAVSGVWIWNKFKLRGSTRQNINSESLGYLYGGFIKLYEAMRDEILRNGGVMAREEVTGISREPDVPSPSGKRTRLRVTGKGPEGRNTAYTFDKALFTAAPQGLATLCEFPADYKNRLARIKYKANICVTLFLKKAVSKYYWVTIADDDAPFVLFIEHTNLIRDEGYKGAHIVYLSRYLDETDPLYNSADAEITAVFLPYVKKMFPNFDERDITASFVSRARYTQPVIYKRYSELRLPFETPIDGLYLASMPQIYPEDRGQNYALALGKRAAEEIV